MQRLRDCHDPAVRDLMDIRPSVQRRRVRTFTCVVVAGLAGCAGARTAPPPNNVGAAAAPTARLEIDSPEVKGQRAADHAELYAQPDPVTWRWHSPHGEVVGTIQWPNRDGDGGVGVTIELAQAGRSLWSCTDAECPLACLDVTCDVGLQLIGDHLVIATMMMNKAIFVPEAVMRFAWQGDTLDAVAIEQDVMCQDTPSSIWAEYCSEIEDE